MERKFWIVWLVFSSLKILAEAAIFQNDIEIYSLRVDCKVTSRFAHTVITSKVANRANESKEALFEVELPKTAFITNFSMTIDGETYPGTIKEKKSAQDQYDAAVSRGQSAGLVKSTGRKVEKFQVAVNVAAAAKVTFELIYEELLKRKLGKYELLIKVKPKQLVQHFQIDTHIFEPQGIGFLETDCTFMTNELDNALTKVQDETKAHIVFKPTITQQQKRPDLQQTLLDGDFLIRYDVKRSVKAGDIQIVNGYFVHYFAPSQMPVFPKNIIFVIDKSGSMIGKKIEQTKEALHKILDDLNPDDHFNIVVFTGSVTEWKPSLLQATETNVELAKQYVETIRAQGATNINSALLTAISALDNATSAEVLPDKSISMIILLTDGEPTVGITNHTQIQENIKHTNQGKYFLYCLGFGFDVSYTFLEKMALANEGIARRIYEDSDAALQLQGFYHEVATPILKEIEMKYPDNAALKITQNNFKLLFDGSEIVVAGKVGNEIEVFPVEIKAQSHTSDLTLKEQTNVKEKEQVFQHHEYIFGNFIERLWAYLTIQQLLEKSVSSEGDQQKRLKDQALGLSLKFNFVTPLTSMVVIKPDAQEVANKPTETDNENFRSMQFFSNVGSAGISFRGYARRKTPPLVQATSGLLNRDLFRMGTSAGKLFTELIIPNVAARITDFTYQPGIIVNVTAVLTSAVCTSTTPLSGSDVPGTATTAKDYSHFILQLPNKNETICLTIKGQSQTPLKLLSDPVKGIQVTGKLGENRHFVQYEVAYQNLSIQINITKEEIMLKHGSNATMIFPWTTAASFSVQGLEITVDGEQRLSLAGADNITIKIHYVKFPGQFLGLYLTGGENFSDQVTGPLGQFYFNTHVKRGRINIQGQMHHITRQRMNDYRIKSRNVVISCWTLTIS